jgi:hypothetical protein
MMFTYTHNAGPFLDVTRDQVVAFSPCRKFRVIRYHAYNADGLVSTSNFGIAILDQVQMDVVCDMLPPEDFDHLVSMPWEDFQAYVNESDRLRRPI